MLIKSTDNGLYCRAGGFYIDPWRPVERAVITHAHADHARPGSKHYLCTASGAGILRHRVHNGATIEGIPFGEHVSHNGVTVSLHPAGHLLGSAQVRVEYQGEVWVVSGDYKIEPDHTCETFEPVPCHTFITESTFGLPIYKWQPQDEVFAAINQWWRANAARGVNSALFAYALGKAQRLLAGVDSTTGPILVHGAVQRFHTPYRNAGITLPDVSKANAENAKATKGNALIIAPPSSLGTTWFKKFQPASTAFASGWMLVRGNRRRRALDQGFVLSDHADWPGLIETIKATGAENIGVTHGQSQPLVRWLNENGYNAWSVRSEYPGERDDNNDETLEDNDDLETTESA